MSVATTSTDPSGALRCGSITPSWSRLTGPLCTSITPNPVRVSKKFINRNCRAIRDLHLCFRKFCLIHDGFQTTILQSRLLWNWKPALDLAKFLSLKTAFHCYLWALFDHARHWISSWPLNKVCYPCQELQLLLRVHCHAKTLSYWSPLVKLASCKRHLK